MLLGTLSMAARDLVQLLYVCHSCVTLFLRYSSGVCGDRTGSCA